MVAYKVVRGLDVRDAAYIAGLIDGEGTVTLTQEHSRENRRLVVSISNTEIALLNHVRTVTGAGRITNKRTYSENHTPSYTYKITNRQALALLEAVLPYLRSYKAKRARLAVKDYVRLTPRNGKYTSTMKRARAGFVEKFLGLQPNLPSAKDAAENSSADPPINRPRGYALPRSAPGASRRR